ncbi:NAD-dependent deacylase [candidate division KSB1 bacterium]|nr:NAD-dependent deacylase [candidate division KSB1 bacterium]
MCESDLIGKAVDSLLNSDYTTVFTGAGISVDSGIPAFRGEDGLWSTYDPIFLDIGNFSLNPKSCWTLIKQIFYDHYAVALPNEAHYAIAKLERLNIVRQIITQNIDNLHQRAGSQNVIEFHGTLNSLKCISCKKILPYEASLLSTLPPRCKSCGGILKPDFVFFGEPIPETAAQDSLKAAELADVFLIIGTTGEVHPAAQLPILAKRNNAKVIEINVKPSLFTDKITDLFLQGRATDKLRLIVQSIEN